METLPLTAADAQKIAEWRYPGPYSTYDVDGLYTAERGVWAVVDGRELIGYCCFGPEARVRGVDEEQGTLDIGYGLRPDLVGRGLGRSFVSVILELAEREFSARRLRLLILSWNERSRKVAENLGFTLERVASNAEGDFLVMVRTAAAGGHEAASLRL